MLKMTTIFAMGAACAALLLFSWPAQSEESTFAKLKAGKEAFDVECEKCHTRKYAEEVDYSRDEWEITMGTMRSNGAQFTDEQREVIVEYLTAKSLLSMKCSVCHSVQRPLSKSKTLEGWTATVTRMSGKKPGHLSSEDISLIAGYLAVERPAE